MPRSPHAPPADSSAAARRLAPRPRVIPTPGDPQQPRPARSSRTGSAIARRVSRANQAAGTRSPSSSAGSRAATAHAPPASSPAHGPPPHPVHHPAPDRSRAPHTPMRVPLWPPRTKATTRFRYSAGYRRRLCHRNADLRSASPAQRANRHIADRERGRGRLEGRNGAPPRDKMVLPDAVREPVPPVCQVLRSNSERGTPDCRMIESRVPTRNSV